MTGFPYGKYIPKPKQWTQFHNGHLAPSNARTYLILCMLPGYANYVAIRLPVNAAVYVTYNWMMKIKTDPIEKSYEGGSVFL